MICHFDIYHQNILLVKNHMKQNQNARGKSRARSNGRGKAVKSKNHNAGNRRDMKVKGNPKQLMEKYITQARDAAQSGDRVMEEYYYQFADHYQRVINELYPNQRQRSSDDSDDKNDEGEDQTDDTSVSEAEGQPKSDDAPRQRGRGRGRHNNRDGNRGRRQNQNTDLEQSVDPADQAQPRMEYPEEMLKEIPIAVKKAEEAEQAGTDSVPEQSPVEEASTEEAPKPKRRGRPRKTDAEKKVASEKKQDAPASPEEAALSLPLDDKGDGAAA